MEYSQSSESIYKGLVVLFDDDRIRYGRQIAYPGFGEEGQEKLKSSHMVVLGVGRLGCAASVYLAYAGIGPYNYRR
jgi:adenylyltransferase/sulfurtransferase